MTTDFADLLRRIPGYAHQIAHVQPLPPRVARFAAPAAPLPDALAAALAARGITQLYAHQAAAINAARAGDHLGVVTASARGNPGRAGQPRAVSVPHQGVGARSAARAE